MSNDSGETSTKSVRVVLWHPDSVRVLLRDDELPALKVSQGMSLPGVLSMEWDIDAWTLHDGGLILGRKGVAYLQALTDDLPEGFSWGVAEVHPPTKAQNWQRPGWPKQAREVFDTALGSTGWIRTGELEPVHSSDLVAILCSETNMGTAYLKAGSTPREAAVTALLSHSMPDLLPPLLWTNAEEGLLVSASGGQLLDGVADLSAWEAAAARLVRFQLTADASALTTLGCPAWPLTEMTERVDALLADHSVLQGWGLTAEHVGALAEARPTIRATFRELAALVLPDLPAHGDAHPRNVLHGPRGSVWFDWSEVASAAHPFMDAGWLLAFALHPARAQLPVRVAHPDLTARLSAAYLNALGCRGADGLLLKSLPLALLHRAAVYDDHFRDWEGTLAGWRPEYTPYSLKQALRELARLG